MKLFGDVISTLQLIVSSQSSIKIKYYRTVSRILHRR